MSGDLRTPDEWCALRGLEVLDPDGWRGADGRGWDEAISEGEFRSRLRICTIRYDATARTYLGESA